MRKLKRIINKMSLTIITILFLSLVYFSFASANEQNYPEDKFDSIHMYNALESNNSFFTSTDDIDIDIDIDSVEKLPEKNTILDNTEKLKDITEKQSISIEKSNNAIYAIENRGKLGTFILGNKLGTLKYQMVQMKDLSHVLYALLEEAEDSATENQINDQVDILASQQIKVENFILKQKDVFSLFGWFLSSL